jgi:ferritin
MPKMISDALADLLVKQIGSELTAHQNYMAISLYFNRLSLDGFGKLFLRQSVEEAQHAKKILDFLVDNDIEFDLPSIMGATTRFATPLDAVLAACASENRVSTEFRTMAKVALDNSDYTGFQFLQWFIEEQTEEESKMNKIKDLVESGINLFDAEPLLESFEEEED